ncbi:vacuolar H+ Ca2+ exchanger protein [Rutstroemia sp. NJR-2017a BBW]|nr:vacuolar H+ Ca2+ exchanger protein [Rutstroemia sp. NJR-2017a BBW]
MAQNNLEYLWQTLQGYGVQFDKNLIKNEYERNPTVVEAWISKYLGPETLLTRDEIALYNELVKSGQAKKLEEAQDLSAICDLNDDQLKTAIYELQLSTAAIKKQSETLRQQQNALALLVKSNTKNSKARSEANSRQLQKWEAEKEQVNSALEELSQGLMYQISDMEQQSKSSQSDVKQTVDGILKGDDKLLASLQKLAADLDPGSKEDDELIDRIRDLCARYIKHTVDGMRTKLDRIYLEALGNPAGPDSNNVNEQEMKDLQEELESLYSEVLPVAQMSAEQQYLEPALREIALRSNQGQERSYQAMKYIQECLNFLVKRTKVYAEHLEQYQSHQMAVKFAIECAKKELQLQASAQPSKPASHGRKQSITQSISRKTRRRSSMFEEMDAEQQILRNLGIALPTESDPDESYGYLEGVLRERAAKVNSHAANLESATEATISSHIRNADVTLQLLHNALQADSVYGEVQLLDPDIISSFNTFEDEIQSLRDSLDAMDLQKLQAKNPHKEQLIERWSR